MSLVLNGLLPHSSGQENRSSLARSDWQLRAEAEFKLRLQQATLRLCSELFEAMDIAEQTKQTALAQNLRLSIPDLLKLADDQAPMRLPEHPACVDYLVSRRSAFLEYTKVYAEHSRQPTAEIITREQKLQKELGATLSGLATGRAQATNPPNSSSAANNATQTTQSEPKNVDPLAHQPTVKNIVLCVRRLVAYAEFKAVGDTSAERDRNQKLEAKKVADFFDKQKDWTLHYPIRDVSFSSSSLAIRVDEPLEFNQVREENQDLKSIKSTQKTWMIRTQSIIRKWESIKPDDLLRVTIAVESSDSLFYLIDLMRMPRNTNWSSFDDSSISSSTKASQRIEFDVLKRREPKPLVTPNIP